MMTNMRKFSLAIFTILISVSLIPNEVTAQYKDFVRKNTLTEYFSITFDKETISITLYDSAETRTIASSFNNINVRNNKIEIANEVSFQSEAIFFNGKKYPYNRILDSRISYENEQTTITFFSDSKPSSRIDKIRAGNIFSFSDSIEVNASDFVRGMVLSIAGHIDVEGEVNKDIISLFGDVKLSSNAVARGDICSITGEIDVETQASIYGEIYSGIEDYDSRRYRFYQENELSFGLMLNYNRVDGVLFGGTLGFVHTDSSFPTVKVGVGYAFESERLRFFLRASQLISRSKSISIGGEYYKKLASDDDYLITDGENLPFVLLATEDYKDYYETEGGAGWLEFHPCQFSTIKTGYRYDDTHWLRAHRNMWSLFGGSKLFPLNYRTVESNYRLFGIDEIELTKNATIFVDALFDSRNTDLATQVSGWLFRGELEWSDTDFSSDFDYRRYMLTIVRYQNINKYSNFRLRGEFAGSDGYLPMYKRFFLGGLGTLWGYKHKEFMGSRYWLANSEYWINLPTNFESNLILFWDVARISNSSSFEEADEVRHDIGVGLVLADIRFNLAKRLDSDLDRDPRFYLRFSRSF